MAPTQRMRQVRAATTILPQAAAAAFHKSWNDFEIRGPLH